MNFKKFKKKKKIKIKIFHFFINFSVLKNMESFINFNLMTSNSYYFVVFIDLSFRFFFSFQTLMLFQNQISYIFPWKKIFIKEKLLLNYFIK